MEKFRQFADESTGINPFIPIWGQKKSSIFQKIIRIPVFAARLVFLLPSIMMYFLFTLLIEAVYFDHLRVILFSIFINGISRVILFVTGCIWIEESTEDVPLSDQNLSLKEEANGKGATSRKIIFSNRQSFTDILIYSSTLGDPEYMFVDKSGVKTVSNSLCGILYSMGFTNNIRVKSLRNGKLETKYSIRPLVVFMEEANTNGSCMLAWNNTGKIADTSEMREVLTKNVETSVINYNLGSSIYGPQFTTGNLPLHIILMLSHITFYKVNLKWVSKDYLANKINSNSIYLKKNEGISLREMQKLKSIENRLTLIQEVQGKTSGLPIVRNGLDEAISFIEYWEKTNRGKSL
ncbi:apicomplexan conserved protein [Cryptosporidium ryanae]|uniref:apicomplexan conserved protein n=1 Tax=Cryptosporidium ryanae TaxID=515981 RepID=UPI003519FB20|nr:apicomplexan conserved protein [Cryptosporidium ryanae]